MPDPRCSHLETGPQPNGNLAKEEAAALAVSSVPLPVNGKGIENVCSAEKKTANAEDVLCGRRSMLRHPGRGSMLSCALQTHDSAADEECGVAGTHAEMVHSYQVRPAPVHQPNQDLKPLVVLTAVGCSPAVVQVKVVAIEKG